MKDQKKAEEIAAERVQLLSPLLAEGLDPAKNRKSRPTYAIRMEYRSARYVGIWKSTAKADLLD